MQEHGKNAEFDFDRDVIGEDLVVGGVAYDSTVWMPDTEDGVRRRTDVVDEPESVSEYEDRLAQDFLRRAKEIGADFAAVHANVSTGPDLAELMPRYTALMSEVDNAGFDRDRIQDTINIAFEPTDAVVEPTESIDERSTFHLDEDLVRGLRAAGNVPPLPQTGANSRTPETPTSAEIYQTRTHRGLEDDGHAV